MLSEYSIRDYNLRLLLYVLALNIVGVLVIRSAAGADSPQVTKQVMGIAVGFFVMAALSLFDYHRILRLSPLLYAGSIICLSAVLFYGVGRGIATRWLVLPVIGQVQPSEFVKIGLIIFFAWFFGKNQERINRFSTLIAAGALFLVIFILIFRQPNLSTSLVAAVVFFCMLFVAGLGWRWILGAAAVLVPCGALFFYLLQYNMVPFLQEYQVNRILAYLNPSLYAEQNLQQHNSMMAIGSGMLSGKGLNNNSVSSVKGGNFLSEEQTDFIFAVIGEELGFIGCIFVIVLIALTVYECLLMAARAKDLQGRLLCAGLASLLAFQSFANIAVATGIIPNTGLTLPFISYGVSSLMSIYAGIGIALNVGLQRRRSG